MMVPPRLSPMAVTTEMRLSDFPLMTCDPKGLRDLFDIHAFDCFVDLFGNWPSELAYLSISKSDMNEGSSVDEFSLFASNKLNRRV